MVRDRAGQPARGRAARRLLRVAARCTARQGGRRRARSGGRCARPGLGRRAVVHAVAGRGQHRADARRRDAARLRARPLRASPGGGRCSPLVTVPFMLPTVVVGAAFLAVLPGSWQSTRARRDRSPTCSSTSPSSCASSAGCGRRSPPISPARRARSAPRRGRSARHVVLPLLRPSLWSAAARSCSCSRSRRSAWSRILGGAGPSDARGGDRPTGDAARRRRRRGGAVDAAAADARRARRGDAAASSGEPPWRCAAGARRRRPRRAIRAATRGRHRRAALVRRDGRAPAGDGAPLVRRRRRLVARRRGASSAARPVGGCRSASTCGPRLRQSLRYARGGRDRSPPWPARSPPSRSPTSRRAGRALDAGSMLPLGTSAVTIGLGMLITFGRAPFDWRASWWLIPVGQALVATPFVVRAARPGAAGHPGGPARRGGDARRVAAPGVVGGRRPGAAPPAARRRGVRRGHLARRVRRDDVPDRAPGGRRCRSRSAGCSGARASWPGRRASPRPRSCWC